MQKYKNRKEVPEKYKWNLTDFFKDDKDFEDNYNKCKKYIDKLKKYKGCTKEASKLLEFLELEVETYDLAQTLEGYAYLISDQELGVSKNMERLNRCSDLFNDYFVNVSFFEPELLNLSNKEYNDLFKNKDLKKYKFMLDQIYRIKEHILDEKSEQIIVQLQNAMNHFDEIHLNNKKKYHYIYSQLRMDWF